jgi:hypothetical protein
VRRHVSIIASFAVPATRAAKAVTATIPIVFVIGADSVEVDLLANLSRPGGNLTGVTFLGRELQRKRLELLHDLLSPAIATGFSRSMSRALCGMRRCGGGFWSKLLRRQYGRFGETKPLGVSLNSTSLSCAKLATRGSAAPPSARASGPIEPVLMMGSMRPRRSSVS